MAVLIVRLKLNTSRDWIAERLVGLGLREIRVSLGKTEVGDRCFLLLANQKFFDALVVVPDDEATEFARKIRLVSPQVVDVSEA